MYLLGKSVALGQQAYRRSKRTSTPFGGRNKNVFATLTRPPEMMGSAVGHVVPSRCSITHYELVQTPSGVMMACSSYPAVLGSIHIVIQSLTARERRGMAYYLHASSFVICSTEFFSTDVASSLAEEQQ